MPNAHLFVLIHGLWGGPKHLLVVEEAIHARLQELLAERITTFRPTTFAFFRTYDGVRFCGERVAHEVLLEVARLGSQGTYVTKMLVVGYLLGGLIARYVIGELFELGVFEHIVPMVFTTFATPHLGVHFFHDTVADKMANNLGAAVLGQSGRDMFAAPTPQLVLVQLADPKGPYLQGLAAFKLRILFANVRNDRTVAFYTAYITNHQPFVKWDSLNVRYLEPVPRVHVAGSAKGPRSGKRYSHPLIVDLIKLHFLKNPRGFFRSPARIVRFIIVVVLAFVVVPVWAPTVLTASGIALLVSTFRRWAVPLPDNKRLWTQVVGLYLEHTDVFEVKVRQQLRRRNTRPKTVAAMEAAATAQPQVLGAVSVSKDADEVVGPLIAKLQTQEAFPVFNDSTRLPFEPARMEIMNNLNALGWIKVPVFVDVWNAHDGMVVRRGAQSSFRGAATVYTWATIVKHQMQ